jgi:hypothetical protein
MENRLQAICDAIASKVTCVELEAEKSLAKQNSI